MGKEDNFKGATGKRFSADNPPKGQGRKKNKFKHLKEKYELSAEDVNTIVEYQMSQPIDELVSIARSKKATAIEVGFASAIISSIKSGDLTAFEILLNRKIGKPKEKVEVSGNVILYLDKQDEGL